MRFRYPNNWRVLERLFRRSCTAKKKCSSSPVLARRPIGRNRNLQPTAGAGASSSLQIRVRQSRSPSYKFGAASEVTVSL